MSISAKSVTKIYGEQKALDNVSFDVRAGEIVGFLGPNGAGKTTMMRILSCFIPQSAGEAFICGYNVGSDSIEVRRQVGYLPENNPLYHDMYVKEYLSFIGGIHKINGVSKKIDEMVGRVGLQSEKSKKIGALSKGFRQRVGLAQVLIHDPKVLILDEPTTGLDPMQIVEIRNIIKQIGKEKTVLLSTHIMQEVEAICDRVIIINKGKIAADSPTAELRHSGSGQSIITVEFDKTVSENDLVRISGVKNVKHLKDFTWQLTAEKDKDVRSDIFQFAVQKGLTVLTVNKETSSMEEIFRQLTK